MRECDYIYILTFLLVLLSRHTLATQDSSWKENSEEPAWDSDLQQRITLNALSLLEEGDEFRRLQTFLGALMEPSISELYDRFEGDILIPKAHPQIQKVEGGAMGLGMPLWPETYPGSQTYEAVYDLKLMQPKIKPLIYWVWNYLMRGSNVKFREARPGETKVIRVFHGEGCYSTLYAPGLLSLGEGCTTLHIIAHETLHSLGMIHEHQRDDRDAYVITNKTGLNDEFRAMLDKIKTGKRTLYDYASIMHYTERFYDGKTQNLIAREPHHAWLIRGRRSWLSLCDWTFLNTIYPGTRKPPICYPNTIPKILKPAKSLGALSILNHSCFYGDESLFETGLCILDTGKTFPALPTIEEELGFNPEYKQELQKHKRTKGLLRNLASINTSRSHQT